MRKDSGRELTIVDINPFVMLFVGESKINSARLSFAKSSDKMKSTGSWFALRKDLSDIPSSRLRSELSAASVGWETHAIIEFRSGAGRGLSLASREVLSLRSSGESDLAMTPCSPRGSSFKLSERSFSVREALSSYCVVLDFCEF